VSAGPGSGVVLVNTTGFAVVAAGAVFGAWGRWLLGIWLNTPGRVLPWGTLAANLIGGLLIGAVVAWLARHPQLDPAWRLFLVTGLLGALTTFSSFSIESLGMMQRGQFMLALVHTLLHVVGSLAAAAVAFAFVSRL
jgi:CrcB protein